MSNVSIIFYCSMLILYQCHMFLLSYYIILRHFIGLTYWQDAQCQFPDFVLFLLRKVTSGNILGITRKFTTIFYWGNEDGSQKGDPGRDPQPRGGSHLRVQGGPRPGVAPGLCGSTEAVLRAPVFICSIKNPRKFSSNFENISRSNFLQEKHDKNRELALGILSIG